MPPLHCKYLQTLIKHNEARQNADGFPISPDRNHIGPKQKKIYQMRVLSCILKLSLFTHSLEEKVVNANKEKKIKKIIYHSFTNFPRENIIVV